MDAFDLDVIDRELLPEDVRDGDGSAYMMVWGRQHTQEQIDMLAAYWGVEIILPWARFGFQRVSKLPWIKLFLSIAIMTMGLCYPYAWTQFSPLHKLHGRQLKLEKIILEPNGH